MASTYTSDINIELIGTGEQAGSWGATTNQNWERVDEAISAYASVPIADGDSAYTWTIANATDAFTDAVVDNGGSSGRAPFVEFVNSGGGSNVDCAITIQGVPGASPRRVFYARNSLTNNADITFDVGGNEAAEKFILLNGATALIYTQLLGSAAENEVHNGFGTVQAEGAVLGTGSANATITTNGAHDLILSTNSTLANSSTITLEDATSGSILLTPSSTGKVKLDDLEFNGTTISTTGGTDLNITPLEGQQIVLDEAIVIDAGVVTGATSITSTAFVGDLTGAASEVTVADESSDTTCFPMFATAATGDVEPKTGSNLSFNSSNGTLAATTFSGALSGNATTATALATGRTIGMTGDVVWTSDSFDGSDNVTGTATIQANSVALGTDTTGSYVQQGATSGNGISGSVNSQGGTFTVTSNAVSAATGSTLVFRDGSGDFSAGTITAALTGNCSGSAATVTTGNQSAITGVGALSSGSITSDFGSIDVGSSAVTAATFTGALVGNVSGASTVASSGAMALSTASNGDITLTPNGTGAVVVASKFNMNSASTFSESSSGVSAGTNVLIGERAGISLTSGSAGGTVAIGEDAATNVTSGDSTIALGWKACGAVTTPDSNIGIGHRALGGDTAGGAATTGAGNTCLGNYAGPLLTSGTFNTSIGGSSSSTLTTGSNNICIGVSALTDAADSASQIVIGNSLTGKGDAVSVLGTDSSYSKLAFGATTWFNTSDSRVKKNISYDVTGLPFIESLRPASFEYKQPGDIDGSEDAEVVKACSGHVLSDGTESSMPKGVRLGFIAQDVKSALDSNSIDVVDSGWGVEPDGIQSVGPSAFIPSLVKAVQELSAQVAGLEARLAAIE